MYLLFSTHSPRSSCYFLVAILINTNFPGFNLNVLWLANSWDKSSCTSFVSLLMITIISTQILIGFCSISFDIIRSLRPTQGLFAACPLCHPETIQERNQQAFLLVSNILKLLDFTAPIWMQPLLKVK